MAISTYTELLTAAANWLSRADLTSRIPEFVTLAQARINRQVRANAMETKSTSITIDAEYEDVPADFLQVKNFYITTGVRASLEPMDSGGMTDRYTTSGRPKFYSVEGTQFRFSPAPDAAYTATLVYYAKPATLATTTQETNSLFPANADLYLYATLLEAESFIQNDARLSVWKTAYDDALTSLNDQSGNWRHGGPLTTRPS
jgi:hypothetical protein